MLRCFERKFPFSNVLGPVKGLLYFDDINFGEKVFIPAYEYSWENIALRLRDMSLQQDHVFDTAPLARHKDCREEKVPEDNDTLVRNTDAEGSVPWRAVISSRRFWACRESGWR